MQRTLASLLVSLSTVWAMGQTVFIPDLQFRDALNAWAPGLVDVDGNMPEDNVAMTPEYFDLTVDWAPSSLEGLGSLQGLRTLVLRVNVADEDFGPPILPVALNNLIMRDYPATAPWPVIPGSLRRLEINGSLRTDLPGPLDDVNSLVIYTMPNLGSIPMLADTVLGLALYNTNVRVIDHSISTIFGGIHVDGNDSLDKISVLTLGPPYSLYIEGCTVLDSITISGGAAGINLVDLPALTYISSFEEGCESIAIYGATSLTDFPTLPESLFSFYISNLTISTFPVLPSDLRVLSVADCSSLTAFLQFPSSLEELSLTVLPLITALSDLPSGLRNLNVYDLPLISLVLPDSLRALSLYQTQLISLTEIPDSLDWLAIGRNPAFNQLAALPVGLSALYMDDLPMPCLPVLPEGLLYFQISNCEFQCQPNYPMLATQYYPLCSIVNSNCPESLSSVSGTVFWDRNENGTRDIGEPGLPNVIVQTDPSGYMTGTDATGSYEMDIPVGEHTIRITPEVPFILGIVPMERTINIQSLVEVFLDHDFAVQLDTVVPDLSVTSRWVAPLRPGSTRQLDLVVQNRGTASNNVELRLQLDPSLEYQSSSIIPTIEGNELVWTWGTVQYGATRRVQCYFNVPTNIPIGTPVNIRSIVFPFIEDVDTLNNVFVNSSEVVGSYDPNDKLVFPATLTPLEGQSGSRVEYLIRFQNTGTSYAERVLITDTLSADLDHSSFRFLGSSHSSTWFYRDGALHFLFAPIYLPDSSEDQLGSNGFVLFSIETLPGLGTEAQIANEANIYFDFNEPVITDPCFLSVAVPDAITEMGQGSARVYPVPSNGIVNVQHNGSWINARATVMNAVGAVVKEGRVEGTTTAFDLRSLPRGLYVLRLQKEGRNWSERIVLE